MMRISLQLLVRQQTLEDRAEKAQDVGVSWMGRKDGRKGRLAAGEEVGEGVGNRKEAGRGGKEMLGIWASYV